jgi:hypothetical protein
VRELWYADLAAGHTEALLPNFPLGADGISGVYDLSPDGRQVVVHAVDAQGKTAPVARASQSPLTTTTLSCPWRIANFWVFRGPRNTVTLLAFALCQRRDS